MRSGSRRPPRCTGTRVWIAPGGGGSNRLSVDLGVDGSMDQVEIALRQRDIRFPGRSQHQLRLSRLSQEACEHQSHCFIRLYIAALHDLRGSHSMLRSRSILGALIVVKHAPRKITIHGDLLSDRARSRPFAALRAVRRQRQRASPLASAPRRYLRDDRDTREEADQVDLPCHPCFSQDRAELGPQGRDLDPEIPGDLTQFPARQERDREPALRR